jgi:hypothetical protein
LKNIKYFYVIFSALTFCGYAYAGELSGERVSVAGLYSTEHYADACRKIKEEGYINIDEDGKMTVYGENSHASIDVCYRLSSGREANATLQGRTLVPGISWKGEPDYQVKVGDDTFGILTEPGSDGNVRWSFHSGKRNSSVNVAGIWNVVNAGDNLYTISGPPLTSPTLSELQAMKCID